MKYDLTTLDPNTSKERLKEMLYYALKYECTLVAPSNILDIALDDLKYTGKYSVLYGFPGTDKDATKTFIETRPTLTAVEVFTNTYYNYLLPISELAYLLSKEHLDIRYIVNLEFPRMNEVFELKNVLTWAQSGHDRLTYKTSSGLYGAPSLSQVKWFLEAVGPGQKVKVSGGVRDIQTMETILRFQQPAQEIIFGSSKLIDQ